MDGLYKGRILYTKEGEAAVVVSCSDDEFSVSYKGKIYRRKADVIGQKLFLKIPQKVREGDSVVLLNIDSGEQETYTIIPSYSERKPKGMGGSYYGISYQENVVSDADPDAGTISDKSPLGSAVLGHTEGEEILIAPPAGNVVRYRIVKILKQ